MRGRLVRFAGVTLAALASAFAPPAGAQPAPRDPAYLACYRSVLAKPPYKDATAEGLDRERLAIGMAVINDCESSLKSLRKDAMKKVKKADQVGQQMGGRSLSFGMAMAFGDIALAGTIAGDLDLVEPRVARLNDERLTIRARKLLASPMDGDPTATDGIGSLGDIEVIERYDACLDQSALRLAAETIAAEAVFGAARNRCAGLRKALVGKAGFMSPMRENMLDGSDKQAEKTFPALTRRIRELQAAPAS